MAIDVGADFAEIDVQETADGAIVLNHDRDLMRVAGVARNISEMTLAEVRAVDIGTRFDPRFAGERIPTLAEVIALARGQDQGPDRAQVLRQGSEARRGRRPAHRSVAVRVAVRRLVPELRGPRGVRRVNPRLSTAAIVTVAIGDIDRLEVDALSVNARKLTNRLIRRGPVNKDVYAWTVDDPRQMVTLMERGVSNIVTNVPGRPGEADGRSSPAWATSSGGCCARYLLGLEAELGAAHPMTISPDRAAPLRHRRTRITRDLGYARGLC